MNGLPASRSLSGRIPLEGPILTHLGFNSSPACVPSQASFLDPTPREPLDVSSLCSHALGNFTNRYRSKRKLILLQNVTSKSWHVVEIASIRSQSECTTILDQQVRFPMLTPQTRTHELDGVVHVGQIVPMLQAQVQTHGGPVTACVQGSDFEGEEDSQPVPVPCDAGALRCQPPTEKSNRLNEWFAIRKSTRNLWTCGR